MPFSELVRMRWNSVISNSVEGFRDTDWTAVGYGVIESGKEVSNRVMDMLKTAEVPKLGVKTGLDGAIEADSVATRLDEPAGDVVDIIPPVKTSQIQLTGGSFEEVKARRKKEAERRLV
jgi:hypothetical protein